MDRSSSWSDDLKLVKKKKKLEAESYRTATVYEERMRWPDDWGHWGRLAVFPVAVKGNRPELQAQRVQGRLEVEEFPSGHLWEKERDG